MSKDKFEKVAEELFEQDAKERDDEHFPNKVRLYFAHPILHRGDQPTWHEEVKERIQKHCKMINIRDSTDLVFVDLPSKIINHDIHEVNEADIVLIDHTGGEMRSGTPCEMMLAALDAQFHFPPLEGEPKRKYIVSVVDNHFVSPWTIGNSHVIVEQDIRKIVDVVQAFYHLSYAIDKGAIYQIIDRNIYLEEEIKKVQEGE